MKRLQSLDALRGFDMLFIMGFCELLTSLFSLFPGEFSNNILHNMHHVPWNGLTHHDTIFPLFLFLAGVSFPFSLAKQREQSKSSWDIHKRIIRRGLLLVLLGYIYNGLLQFNFAEMRYASVLGRIGLAWMFGALIYLHTDYKKQIGIIAGILIGYWLLLRFFPAPDVLNAHPYSIEGSLTGYIDRQLLPGKLHNGIHDPEGLLSTIPAICTALLGMLAGNIIKNKDKSGKEKTMYLFFTGIFLLITGLLWNIVFPVNKNLWTSSFVCVVGSYSYLLFSIFYYLIDVKGFQRWTFPFRVIGMNSITIYLAQEIINFHQITAFFLGGIITNAGSALGPVIQWAGYVACCWTFLWILYKKNIFLKV